VVGVISNETTLTCITPIIIGNVSQVNLMITSDGKNISEVLKMRVIRSPDILHLEPLSTQISELIVFTVIVNTSVDTEIKCTLGGVYGTIQLPETISNTSINNGYIPDTGVTFYCILKNFQGIKLNEVFSLYLYETLFYSIDIEVLPAVLIQRAYPLQGFISVSTGMTY
jgi:hypothetical protein